MARAPIHPGEILVDELETRGLRVAELARIIHVPPRTGLPKSSMANVISLLTPRNQRNQSEISERNQGQTTISEY
jgi:hypothetical protein